MKLEDNPSYLNFPGVGDEISYSEGIFVGYRYYDKKKMDVRFPFGYGLSYTQFEYSDLVISENEIKDDQTLTVSCSITNTGKMAGMEVVQLYVGDKESSVVRPVKELKGFEKVSLKPGETKKVFFSLDKRAFAYYETAINDWFVEYGEFEIMIGSSSRDIRLSGSVYVNSEAKLPVHFTFNSTDGDVLSCSEGREVFGGLIEKMCRSMFDMTGTGLGIDPMELAMAMIREAPLRGLVTNDPRPEISRVWLQEMLDKLNGMLEE
jgi:beta-glucosidase